MWNPFDRRKRSRREEDAQKNWELMLQKKKEAMEECLTKMNQWHNGTDRRFHSVDVPFERRRA